MSLALVGDPSEVLSPGENCRPTRRGSPLSLFALRRSLGFNERADGGLLPLDRPFQITKVVHARAATLHLRDRFLELAALVVEQVDVSLNAGVPALLVILAGPRGVPPQKRISGECPPRQNDGIHSTGLRGRPLVLTPNLVRYA